jgi:NADH:ubiquinone oxidoreductase subunit 4 (subunit M)
MSHPLVGFLLPVATAMNAVTVFRLFTRLFLGKRHTGFTAMADALPRERWVLAAAVLFVVLGGLFPNAIVAQRSEITARAAITTPTTGSVRATIMSRSMASNPKGSEQEDRGQEFQRDR